MYRPYFEPERITFDEINQYKIHRRMIENMKSKMNLGGTSLPADNYVKSGILKVDAEKLGETENQNRAVARKLYVVGRKPGAINAKGDISYVKSNFRKREIDKEAIEKKNKSLYKQVGRVQSRFSVKQTLQEFKKHTEILKNKTRYPKFYDELSKDNWSIAPDNIDKSILDPNQRVRCYMNLGVKMKDSGEYMKIGKLTYEIWMDVAPIAGCNFINLCNGYDGYSYKNTPFHLIFQDLFCIGGDVVNKSGTGVYSVYGGTNSSFGDENCTLEFNGPGVVACHTVFAGDNHAQYMITFRRLVTMNKNFVVFGRVINSDSVLDTIQSFANVGGVPTQEIKVLNCGVMKKAMVPIPFQYFSEIPDKVSPEPSAAQEGQITLFDCICERAIDKNLVKAQRGSLIAKARTSMKELGYSIYKLDMPPPKPINCLQIINKK